MTANQFFYLCGFDQPVRLVLNSGKTVEGVLKRMDTQEIVVENSLGSLQSVAADTLSKVERVPRKADDDCRAIVTRVNKSCNALSQAAPVGILNWYADDIERAKTILAGRTEPPESALFRLLSDPARIKERAVAPTDLPLLERAARRLNGEDALCRAVLFLVYYAVGHFSEAMNLYTTLLCEDDESALKARLGEVYRALGMASWHIGQSKEMFLYWMTRYYRVLPARALADNDIHCDALWVFYLDVCCEMISYDHLPEIFDGLCRSGDANGLCCAYASLIRLFRRSALHTLAFEAALAFEAPETALRRVRSPMELASSLHSATDSYTALAFRAADRILDRFQEEGIRCYPPPETVSETVRLGYLYDYVSGRHGARLLGYDLLTYFLPVEKIPRDKLKLLNKSFDLSQYRMTREELLLLSFRAEPSARRSGYTVRELV